MAYTAQEADWIGLRQYLELVDEVGELERVSGAHWNKEMSTISHETARGPRHPTPALLFDDIPDYPSGHRTLYGMTNSMNRYGITTGLGTGYEHEIDFLKDYREYQHEIENVDALDPEFVDRDDAPLMENVQEGEDVDLLSMPVPLHHDEDGGRYIGTADCFISQDPDTERVNLGVYRMQVFDDNRCGVYISPGKHGDSDIKKYAERDERMPVAATFGQDPTLWLFASIGLEHEHPYGEYAHTGGLKRKPFPVVEGPVTGLPLPAYGEIAIEGYIEPGDTEWEGPFGEWMGYYGRNADEEPAITVEALYHRTNPIHTAAVPARPPYDYSYHKSLSRSANLWDQLEDTGVPGVKGVWRTEAGGSRLFNIISIEQQYAGHSREAGYVASHGRAGGYANRWTVVVDDDIDPTNWQDVAWAMSTRCDPEQDIEIQRRCWSTPLDPLVEKAGTEPGKKDLCFNTRAMVDATIPYERLDDFANVVEAPPEYRDEVRENWSDVIEGDT